jgi:hypothetical protein
MCQCPSCEYTDGFSGKGFAEWPEREPVSQRKANATYAAHVAFGKRTKDREFTDAELRFVPGFAPKVASGTGMYAPKLEIPDAIERTMAEYIAEFDRLNKLVIKAPEKQIPAEAGTVRITTPAKAPKHFRRGNRPRQHRRVYAMEKVRKARGMAETTRAALADVAAGMTAYAAAKKHGIALSTIYRALGRSNPRPPAAPS